MSFEEFYEKSLNTQPVKNKKKFNFFKIDSTTLTKNKIKEQYISESIFIHPSVLDKYKITITTGFVLLFGFLFMNAITDSHNKSVVHSKSQMIQQIDSKKISKNFYNLQFEEQAKFNIINYIYQNQYNLNHEDYNQFVSNFDFNKNDNTYSPYIDQLFTLGYQKELPIYLEDNLQIKTSNIYNQNGFIKSDNVPAIASLFNESQISEILKKIDYNNTNNLSNSIFLERIFRIYNFEHAIFNKNQMNHIIDNTTEWKHNNAVNIILSNKKLLKNIKTHYGAEFEKIITNTDINNIPFNNIYNNNIQNTRPQQIPHSPSVYYNTLHLALSSLDFNDLSAHEWNLLLNNTNLDRFDHNEQMLVKLDLLKTHIKKVELFEKMLEDSNIKTDKTDDIKQIDSLKYKKILVDKKFEHNKANISNFDKTKTEILKEYNKEIIYKKENINLEKKFNEEMNQHDREIFEQYNKIKKN